MEEIIFCITNNCNLKCDHCCADCGPRQPSIAIKDMKKVIDNFVWDISSLQITGGEIFTRKKLLYTTLEYVQQQKFRKLKKVRVQTNGFWASSEKKVNKTLDELLELGATEVEISSNTVNHWRAGLNLDRPRLLEKILLKRDLGFRREYFPIKKHFMTGRGLTKLKKKHIGFYEKDKEIHYDCKLIKKSLTINYKGDIFPCCWIVPGTEIGNAMEDRIYRIVNKTFKNEVFTTLMGKDGPKKLARKIGLDKEIIEEYSDYGLCTLCSYMFNNKLIKL
ncbi:MAG: radical SAM protein [Nanoarchaeota archaeon]|nr:radical SAM protein [Nanoarchaeota archaeon]MBU4352145.1 radical SAM protein [Nanoarchaeota archaeon]MBU4456139.1 radical SAM protein [Nanoarchaeota archaeon]MCG2719135.1 radical SAM protein [Nanoarchaeota archaeon]